MKLIGLYDTMPTPTSTNEVLRVGKGCFYKVYKASQTREGLQWKWVGVSSDNDLDNMLWDDRVLGADEDIDNMSTAGILLALLSLGTAIHYNMMQSEDEYEESK